MRLQAAGDATGDMQIPRIGLAWTVATGCKCGVAKILAMAQQTVKWGLHRGIPRSFFGAVRA